MEYILIVISLVTAITCLIIFSRNKTEQKSRDFTENLDNSILSTITNKKNNSHDLVIQMELLPTEYKIDESKLVEITNSEILTRINNLVPGMAQVGNATNNAFHAAQANGEVLYRAILPASAKLTNSNAMGNAFRGFYRDADNIRGHANFVSVEAQHGATVVANTVAAAMGVASIVVGQYYMTQINSELGEISNGISKISDFQDNEYRSRVFSLITHVKRIADFQVEILENNELRLNKIAQLDSLEEECTQLVGQANLTLVDYTKKGDIDFNSYERELKEAQNWLLYQKSLLDILYKISELRYTLHLGSVSREQCTALLPIYYQQVVDTKTRLTNWHKSIVKKLNIDIEENKRKRDGIDGIIHFIPGLIKNEMNYREIDKNTVNIIGDQIYGNCSNYQHKQSELYKEDVQLISKEGKIFYLPETSE